MGRLALVAPHAEGWKGRLELPILVALALAGAGIALGIARLSGFGPDSFQRSGQFKLWLFVIAVQGSIWAIAADSLLSGPIPWTLRGIWADARHDVIGTVAAAALPLYGFIIAVAVHPVVRPADLPLPAHRWKLLALQGVATTVALIGVAQLAILKAAFQREPAAGTAADVARYRDLRSVLQRLLAIEGAILAAAVLAVGALRNAVVAYTHHQASYPREYIFIVGVYLTLVLALFYAPVYRSALEAGRANLNGACPPVEPASAEWLPTHEKRERLSQFLQLEVTTSASFRAGIAIVAPLASALVTLLIG